MPVQLQPPDWSQCTSKCRWTRGGALHSCLQPCGDNLGFDGCGKSLFRVNINGECEYDQSAAMGASSDIIDSSLPPDAVYGQAKIEVTIEYDGPYGKETAFFSTGWGFNAFYVGSGSVFNTGHKPGLGVYFAGFYGTPAVTESLGINSFFSGPVFSLAYVMFNADEPCSSYVVRETAFGWTAGGTYTPTYSVRDARSQGQGTVSTDGATGFTISGKVELYPLTGPNAGLTESVHDIFYEKEEPIPIADYSGSVYTVGATTDEFGGSSNGDHLGLFYNLSTGGYGAIAPSMALTIPSGYGVRSQRGPDMVKTTFQPLSGTTTRDFTIFSQW